MTKIESTKRELEKAIRTFSAFQSESIEQLMCSIEAYGAVRYQALPAEQVAKSCGCKPVENTYCLEHARDALAPKTITPGRAPTVVMTAEQAADLLGPSFLDAPHAVHIAAGPVAADLTNHVNHYPNCDCASSSDDFDCDTCGLRFGPCVGVGDEHPDSCDRCANLKVAQARITELETMVGHDVSSWQACARCSEVRTKFITWLREQMDVREDATIEEFKAAIRASLDELANLKEKRA